MITAVLLLALAQDPPRQLELVPPDTIYTRGELLRWGRVIGTMAAGAGLILLGVATGYFANAAALDHQRQLVCASNPCTEPTAYRLYARAGTSQNVGVLLSSIGSPLVLAGGLLFFFKGDF